MLETDDIEQEPDPMDLLVLEQAVKKPWLYAEDGSLWIASGVYLGGKGTFTDCLLRKVPESITGSQQDPLFEVLLYGRLRQANGSWITRAVEQVLVPRYDDEGEEITS